MFNFKKVSFYFSQQFDFVDDQDLATKLSMQQGDIKKFEVFITPLQDGNIDNALDDPFNAPNLDQIKDIIDQLFEGLKQLKDADACHNDIKPGNVLYRLAQNKFEIKIADFGQSNKKGGTPGWTAPVFRRDRTPGKEDMFSMGLIILRLLCYEKDLFFALRDNWVNLSGLTQLKFNNMPEINLIRKMINLDNQPTIQVAEREWRSVKSNVQIIDYLRLCNIGVLYDSLIPQYSHSR